jgi:hypothetical protein
MSQKKKKKISDAKIKSSNPAAFGACSFPQYMA